MSAFGHHNRYISYDPTVAVPLQQFCPTRFHGNGHRR